MASNESNNKFSNGTTNSDAFVNAQESKLKEILRSGDYHSKNVAGQSLDALNQMKSYKEKIVRIFSLAENSMEKMKKNEQYPSLMRVWHLVRSAGIGLLAGAPLALGGLFIIGGTNASLWTPLLYGTFFSIGAATLASLAIPLFKNSKKKFDIYNIKNRSIVERLFRFLSRRALISRSHLALFAEKNMDSILSGNFTLANKDDYKKLSRLSKWRLKRIISKYNKAHETLSNNDKVLGVRAVKTSPPNTTTTPPVNEKQKNVAIIKPLGGKGKTVPARTNPPPNLAKVHQKPHSPINTMTINNPEFKNLPKGTKIKYTKDGVLYRLRKISGDTYAILEVVYKDTGGNSTNDGSVLKDSEGNHRVRKTRGRK